MKRLALTPDGFGAAGKDLKMSAGIVSGGHVFLSGMTGARPDGSMPGDPAEQFHAAFDKIGAILSEAGLDHGAIVEMTSYHVGIADHFEVFNAVRAAYVAAPFPAWTAVEVAGLRRPGALVEIRVVAALPG